MIKIVSVKTTSNNIVKFRSIIFKGVIILFLMNLVFENIGKTSGYLFATKGVTIISSGISMFIKYDVMRNLK